MIAVLASALVGAMLSCEPFQEPGAGIPAHRVSPGSDFSRTFAGHIEADPTGPRFDRIPDRESRTPAAQAPPRILLDQSPRAVEYQLSRLTNDELVRLERKDDDARYRLVYVALLTRRGLARAIRDEAVAALVKLDKISATRVLIDALARVPVDDDATGAQLLAIVFGQPGATLRTERGALLQAAGESAQPWLLRAAYGAVMIADDGPDAGWEAAIRQGHLPELLRSVAWLGDTAVALRGKLFTPIAALLAGTPDAPTRAAAMAALGWTRRDTATFAVLAAEILQGTDAESRTAAVRSLELIPEPVWQKDQLEPLAHAIVALVKGTPPDRRTDPAAIDIIQFGERVAAALPAEARRATLRDLRAMGVRVIRIATVPEQMLYDVKWFVVEAGKPVQIVLTNADTMPHNIVIARPGSLREVATTAAMVPLPSDPEVKAYVPDSPLVLESTRLVNGGETERLNFAAPSEPGEYVYLCTFPGHWVRMYGVMLVVSSLEAWEATRTVPADPVTNKPFVSQR